MNKKRAFKTLRIILLCAVLLFGSTLGEFGQVFAATTIKTSSLSSGSTLTLKQDTTLNIDKSVTIKNIVNENYKLTITGSATLTITNSDGPAIDVDSVTISSGTVKATANNHSAIIAVNDYVQKGGTVTATSGMENGCAVYTHNGNVTISGGTITAKATGANGAGLYSNSGNIIIKGGTVNATTTGSAGVGISTYSGTISVNGGKTTINSKSVGIISTGNFTMDAGTVSITVNAASGSYANGINSQGSLTISGGTATMSMSGTNSIGLYSNKGPIKISGGTVKVTGANNGIYGKGAAVQISGGETTLTSDAESCIGVAISDANFTISNGTVNITTPDDSGAGLYVVGGNVTVKGGTVDVKKCEVGIYNDGQISFSAGKFIANAPASGGVGLYSSTESITASGSSYVELTAGYKALYPSVDISGHNVGGAFVNSTASASGRTEWNGSTDLSSYKYVRIPGPDTTTPVISSLTNGGTDKGVVIKWTAGADYTKFRVQRKAEGESSWTTLSSTVTGKTYTDETATVGGKTYTYRVCGYYDQWYSYSATKSIVRNPFKDVSNSASYFKALMWAFNNGIVAGTSTTTFDPNSNCTRGQFALMLWRMNGKPSTSGLTNPFKDVTSSNGFYKGIIWCYSQGITAGTSATTYSPDDNIKRWQMILMFWRMEGKPASSLTKNPFTDVKTSASYYKAALWAYEKGITGVKEFMPNDLCTRWQLVLFLYRLNNLHHYI